MGPCDLDELLKRLPPSNHPELLIPPEHGADASVYRVAPDLAIAQSADFFPPMIADARAFGRLAAANALSDIYAVGAKPVTAISLLATPKNEGIDSLVAMLEGAHEAVEEAGAVIAGGHTLLDDKVMFGMSATGVVHPDKLVRHNTPQAGDLLVLTKPLGTGITVHAYNAGQATDADLARCVELMVTLNRAAGEMLYEAGAHASTDVTGFGFLGHALDMLSLGQVGFDIDYSRVPKLPQVEELALAGNYPGGSKRNIEYTDGNVEFADCPEAARLLLNDAQTSGGLLIALPEDGAAKLLRALEQSGYTLEAAVIGRAVAEHAGRIRVR
ncbi:selenide, water dikinase SelD [bacterium]|nr:selenide, water dikinase SelD [bacterium]